MPILQKLQVKWNSFDEKKPDALTVIVIKYRVRDEAQQSYLLAQVDEEGILRTLTDEQYPWVEHAVFKGEFMFELLEWAVFPFLPLMIN